MEALDRKLQELLSKKFDGAEMDVDPSIWEGINDSLQPVGGTKVEQGLNGAGKGIFGSSSLWIAASVIIIGSITVALWPSNDQENPAIAEQKVDPSVAELIEQDSPIEEIASVELSQQLEETLENEIATTVVEQVLPVVQEQEPAEAEVATGSEVETPSMANPVHEEPGIDANTAEESNAEPDEDDTDVIPNDPIEDPVVVNPPPVQSFDNGEGIVRPLANVFSPNGDGVNDFYLPELNGPERVFIQVIQMTTGEVVFKADRLESWLGRGLSGQELPAGSYLYVIEMTDENGETDQASQIVRLFR